MNIKIDSEYRVISDAYNYTLQVHKKTTKKNGTEEYIWKNTAHKPYNTTVSGALQSYVEIKLKESKTRTFPSFIKEMQKLESKMVDILKIADIKPLTRKG